VIYVDARPTEIEVATLSDIGRQRSSNQDSCGDFTGRQGWRLFVVADGMGGHQGGATASGLAVEAIRDVLKRSQSPPIAMLHEAFEAANRRIYETASQNLALQGMGTTAVVLLLDGTEAAWVAHVGDSRAYRLRANRLEPLTKDHSVVVQLMETKGLTREEAEQSPNSHVLLRAIGVEPEVEADVKPVPLELGDRFLLCSDGLWGEVPDVEIAEVLQRHTCC
jgi:protein phosphatase